MTISRIFSALALSAAMSFAGPQTGVAQSLSDASLIMSSDWSSGYMGLGGNLGRAIEHRPHHRAKSAKSAKAAHTGKSAKASRVEHNTERRRAHVERTNYTPKKRESSPSFLIAQSLDHSGLTINTLRLQPFP